MFKLILWLTGLLLAILTMNVTVYLLLSVVWIAGRSIAQYRVRRLLRGQEKAEADRSIP